MNQHGCKPEHAIVRTLKPQGIAMSKDEKIINRLSISIHDLDDCKRFLQELSRHKDSSVAYEALLITAIIFYTRPFSGNERDKKAAAESKVDDKVLENLTDEERKLHNKLLTLRNKAIAHSEWNYHPTRVSKNGMVIKSMPFSIWKEFPPPSRDIVAFSSLVNKVWLKANHLITAHLRSYNIMGLE